MAFHVNPKTGNSGICRAKNDGCPFGSLEEHFSSREQAQKGYELKQEKFEKFLGKSKMPATPGSYVIDSYDPMSEEVPVGQLCGNPTYEKFKKKLAAAQDNERLVLENGQVWEKSKLYDDDSWKFVAGHYDFLTGLERGRTYDMSYLTSTIQQHGARLEAGGALPKMAIEHRRDIYPAPEEISDEAKELAAEFTPDNAPPEEQSLNEYLDDYVAERWSGLTPQHWQTIRLSLDKALGTPKNVGTETEPSWLWAS